MTLAEFSIRCQADVRLSSAWRKLLLCAHGVIGDVLGRAFRGTESHLSVQHREAFNQARAELLIQCAHAQAPELSVRQFIEFLLQYE